MYSSYGNYPTVNNNSGYSYGANTAYGSNYQNFGNNQSGDDRLIGGGSFLFPFVLGGLTGGLLAPSFYQRPYYPYPYYPRPYYPYPYYR